MYLRKDITGQKQHKLTAIAPVRKPEHIKKKYGTYWKCKCECGNYTVISQSEFGKTKSCGCALVERSRKWLKSTTFDSYRKRLPAGEAEFNQLVNLHKQRAKKRGLLWKLTDSEARILFKGHCYYCGIEPLQVKMPPRDSPNNKPYLWNGIDRIDSMKGYTSENSRSCCGQCNRAKGEMPEPMFKEWVQKLSNRYLREVA